MRTWTWVKINRSTVGVFAGSVLAAGAVAGILCAALN